MSRRARWAASWPRAAFTVCSGGYGGVMEAASRGAKEAGGRTLAVTATFFRSRSQRLGGRGALVDTWQERLFELIRVGHGYVACKGGTGTLVELAVVWEMLNKGVMAGKPFVVLGEFWTPILERVREVELDHGSRWGEAGARLVHMAPTPADAAEFFVRSVCARDALRQSMSRPAEEILEFDRLRELLRARTTSAPGRRAVDALAFGTDRARAGTRIRRHRRSHGLSARGQRNGFRRAGRSGAVA